MNNLGRFLNMEIVYAVNSKEDADALAKLIIESKAVEQKEVEIFFKRINEILENGEEDNCIRIFEYKEHENSQVILLLRRASRETYATLQKREVYDFSQVVYNDGDVIKFLNGTTGTYSKGFISTEKFGDISMSSYFGKVHKNIRALNIVE